MLRDHRFDDVAGADEEPLRVAVVKDFDADLVAVVVVRDLFGARDQQPADAAAPALRDDVERFDMGQRRGDAQPQRALDPVALARHHVVGLLVPDDAKLPQLAAPVAVVLPPERVGRAGRSGLDLKRHRRSSRRRPRTS